MYGLVLTVQQLVFWKYCFKRQNTNKLFLIQKVAKCPQNFVSLIQDFCRPLMLSLFQNTHFWDQNEIHLFVVFLCLVYIWKYIRRGFKRYLHQNNISWQLNFKWLNSIQCPNWTAFTQKSKQIGSYFQVFCAVQEGSPPLFFSWSKNGVIIKSSPNVNYKIDNSRNVLDLLIIERLERTDAANYTCTVSNSIGSDTQTVVLNYQR